jgi:two-component system, sensor histidine kinase
MSMSAWERAWSFDEPRVLQAQMTLIDRNYVPAFLASVAITLIATLGLHAVTRNPSVWAWAMLQVALGGGCVLARPFLPSLLDAGSVIQYAHSLRRMALLVGLGWGALGLWIDPAQPLTLTIILGVEGGMTAGALAVFSPCWSMAMAFWLGAIVPMIVLLLAGHDWVMGLFGGAATVYLVVMATFGYHAGQTTLRAIQLGFENEGLVRRLRDQTQRALEARQLAEGALSDAEEANRAKTVFLASVSHDLRQPLHAMGLVLGALSRAGLTERQQALLGQAQASALATGDMLGTLLDFSKVDAGVVKPHPQPFNLQLLFAKLARELAPVAEAKGLVFRVRDTAAVLHSDPALVELILRNLLLNAIRYTDRGGVLLACRSRGARASVEVWDSGVGIPADQHEEIFREFHQLGNPERDRNKGLGLGLAIVQGLARTLSVEVTLDSRPGRGTVFRLLLPHSHQAWQDELRPLGDEPDLHGLKVLLIDDDEHVCAAMRDLLATWGCLCEDVACEEQAAARLTQFEPDVVMTDYRLRGHRTGLQALERVRTELGRPIPAAIITGDTAPERLQEAAASGLLLLHKPVPAERLQAVLLGLWQEAKSQSQTQNQGPVQPRLNP